MNALRLWGCIAAVVVGLGLVFGLRAFGIALTVTGAVGIATIVGEEVRRGRA